MKYLFIDLSTFTNPNTVRLAMSLSYYLAIFGDELDFYKVVLAILTAFNLVPHTVHYPGGLISVDYYLVIIIANILFCPNFIKENSSAWTEGEKVCLNLTQVVIKPPISVRLTLSGTVF